MNLQKLKEHLSELKKKYPKNYILKHLESKTADKIKKITEGGANSISVSTVPMSETAQIVAADEDWSYILLDEDEDTEVSSIVSSQADQFTIPGTKLAKIANQLDQAITEEVQRREACQKEMKAALQAVRKELFQQHDVPVLYQKLKDTEAFVSFSDILESHLTAYLNEKIAEDRKAQARKILATINDLKTNSQQDAPHKFSQLLQTLFAVRVAIDEEDQKHWNRNALTGGRLNKLVARAITRIENSPSKFVRHALGKVGAQKNAKDFLGYLKQELEDYQSSFFHTRERKTQAQALLSAAKRNMAKPGKAEEKAADFFSELYQVQVETLEKDQQRNVLTKFLFKSEGDELSCLVEGAIQGILAKAESNYALAQAIKRVLAEDRENLQPGKRLAVPQRAQLRDFYQGKLQRIATADELNIYEDQVALF